MEKKRIQFYTDSETKRRIEQAAAQYHMSVTEYCLTAIRQKLTSDNAPEAEQVAIPATDANEEDPLISDLRELHKEILASRGGEPLDVDDDLSQMRDERTNDIAGLR